MNQQILERKRIRAEFNNIFDYSLTVAVAAMGYGKTTAARSFLDEIEANYIWLSVENEESSPQYIWDSLTRQLTRIYEEAGKQLRALGFPVHAIQRDKVLEIIENRTYLTNIILVIDDYHFAHSPELNKLIERIVRADIEGFHILILSRTIPDINIDELMIKGFCYLIKNHFFELSKSEIKEYFHLYSYDISDHMAKQIHSISEGWVSAVYLIMQRYAETRKVEPGNSIDRLIETAVMQRYDFREVEMLKSLCILESFTPQQAIYVTNDRSTERIIRKISQSNSFIRYDAKQGTYRIHNIFKNHLRRLLESQASEEEINNLYRHSGQWLIDNGDILSGLKHLLRAKEYDFIMSEFKKSRIIEVIDSNPLYIIELFKSIPLSVKYRHPIGYIAYIGFYVTNVDREEGEKLLLEIEQYYQEHFNAISLPQRRILGEIELIKAYISFNDISQMGERLLKAHKMLEGNSLIANKDKIATFGSPHILYLYYKDMGKMLWTVESLGHIYPYYMEMASGCGIGFEYQVRAEYSLENGNLDEAEIYAQKAMYKARTLDQISIIICSNFSLARIRIAQGKMNEAKEILDHLKAEVDACNSPILSSAYDLCGGYIGGIMEEENDFAKWLRIGDMNQSEILYQGMGFNDIVYGKYLLMKAEYIRLEVLCEEMKKTFLQFDNQLGHLHSYIMNAIAEYNLYGLERAKTAIIPALNLSREDHMILPFGEYGIYIIEILKSLRNDMKNDSYLKGVISFVTAYIKKLKRKKISQPLTFSLTNREMEILKLIVEGKTNKEIAASLYIAEVTVRKNITALYRKLEVSGRAAAIKKVLELKII